MIPVDELQMIATRTLGVSDTLWRSAADRAGTDPERILGLLTRTRAEWAPEADPSMAVTEYQARLIQAHGGPLAELIRKLTWNRYVVLQPLGKGGMGRVMKGWDPIERRYVALKQPLEEGGETVARLLKEGELLQRLTHPNVAQVYAVETIDDLPLLVLEFVSGTELRALVDEKAGAKVRIPWPDAVAWCVDILQALAAMHAVHVIHRDVKPANVVLREVGKKYSAVLVDMGLGKQLGSAGLTTNLLPMGTLAYMPPEQWKGGASAEPASDVYSLGVTLYEVLAARPPFAGPELHEYCLQHMNESPPPLQQYRSDVPGKLDRLIQRMLAKKPADRGSAAGLAVELSKIAGLDLAPTLPLRHPPVEPVRRPTTTEGNTPVRRVTPVDRLRPVTPPRRDDDPITLLPVGSRKTIGSFALLGIVWRLVRTRLQRLSGPPSEDITEAEFERNNRLEMSRLWRQFRTGIGDRRKMLVSPHRFPLEWGFLLAVVAFGARLLRVW